MNSKTKILAIFLILTLCSCDNDADQTPPETEPILLERFYFEGKLDDVPFLIEKNIYDVYTPDDPLTVDYGGTLISCAETPEDEVPYDCYTQYSSGILVQEQAYPNEVGKHTVAKAYFGKIEVEKREFDITRSTERIFTEQKSAIP